MLFFQLHYDLKHKLGRTNIQENNTPYSKTRTLIVSVVPTTPGYWPKQETIISPDDKSLLHRNFVQF